MSDEDSKRVALATSAIESQTPLGEPLPGTPYRLIRPLGGGGMGHVYLAQHKELGSEAAVKLLTPDLADDEKAMERLRREARAAAQIGNPHIIEIYDLGVTEDRRPYVVMRRVRGRDLKSALDEGGPMEPGRVVGLVKQIASALTDAHRVGVIHRDLKPENVMLEDRPTGEHATILDFGIAQSLEEADRDTRLTRQGQIVGTPGYIAPEQALAKPIDGRADQYALAVIVYELLSGDSPYPRVTPLQLLAAQLSQEPAPLADKVPHSRVPEAMQAVVMRGMAKEPEQRYASIAEFAAALEDSLLPGAVAPAPVVAPPPKSRAPLIVGGLALVGVVVGVAVALVGGKPPPEAPPPPAPVVAAAPPSTTPPKPAPDAATAPEVAAAPDAAAAPEVAAAPDAAAPEVAAAPKPDKPRWRPRPKSTEPPKPAAQPEPRKPEPVVAAPAPEPEPAPEPKPEPKPEPVVAAVAAPPPPPPPPAPAGPGKLVIAPAEVGAGVSANKVRKALAEADPRIRSCVDAKKLPAGRAAVVSGHIGTDNFVTVRGQSGDAALASCAAQALKGLKRIRLRDNPGVDVKLKLRTEAP